MRLGFGFLILLFGILSSANLVHADIQSLPMASISQNDIYEFVNKCRFSQLSNPKGDVRLSGAHIGGATPVAFAEYNSGEGTQAVMYFDMSLRDLRKLLPKQTTRLKMTVPREMRRKYSSMIRESGQDGTDNPYPGKSWISCFAYMRDSND